ncbi:MAG: hypothetical protein ABL931_23195 [Usitatibacteraceae bacterium]
MIEGMAHAGRVFARSDWIVSARRALVFIQSTMWNPATKRLLATHKDGKTHLNAYLDDYAFLIKAVVGVLQADFRPEDLQFARALADVLLEQFEDKAAGGFFFTSHDHEQLIQRPKPGHDNATPSGNGVAALALQRLAHLTDNLRYAESAQRAIACYFEQISDQPSGFGSLLMALEEQLLPPRVVILAGPERGLPAFQTALAGTYLPSTLVLAIKGGTSQLPAALTRPDTPDVNAYVCQGVTCLAPVADVGKLLESLKIPIVSL